MKKLFTAIWLSVAAAVAVAGSSATTAPSFIQAGAGAISRTLQDKARESVTVKDFGVTGTGDETAKVQMALNSGAARVIVPAGLTASVSTVTLQDGQTLEIHGKMKKVSGTSPIIIMGNGSAVLGGEIDGNSVAADGIFAAEKSNVLVRGVYIHHVGKKCITSYTSGDKLTVTDNRVENCGEQAISAEYTNNALIANNKVDTALHGIQYWGGDANTSTVVGITNLVITGNVVKNAMGCIWGSNGSHISIAGNHVENCTDVGIDIEGGLNFSVTGNSAYECANGCYSVFYGAKFGTFSGNSAYNATSAGAGFYATTNGSYINEYITIASNNFRVIGVGVYVNSMAGRGLANSSITGNLMTSTSNHAIYLGEATNLIVSDNHLTTVNVGSGVKLDGTSNSLIRDNSLIGYSDTSVSPAAAGGILLLRRSASWPSQSNIVRGNRVTGYAYSITDNCAADVTQSKNDIEHNHVTNIYRAAGGGYNGVIAENVDILTPATAVTATTF